MKFWTILLITYGMAEFEGEISPIPFVAMENCGDAMETLYDLMAEADPDVMVQCIETALPSGSVRPMKRPDHLEGHW